MFHRCDGKPLHPQYVLNHFHDLCAQAGVPRITVHDLRHLTATLSMTARVPLPVVSKTLRHATLSTTANLYSHLSSQAARGAVDSVDYTLTHAAHDHHATTGFRPLLRPRMGKELFSEAA